MVIGLEDTATGTVRVSGGGMLNLNGGSSQLVVGSSGAGNLLVNNSTVALGGNLFAGAGTTSTGMIVVDGGALTAAGQVQVGGSGGTPGGPGTMSLLNGAVANSGGLTNVYTVGTLNVGAGTTPASYTSGADMTVNGRVNYNSGTLTAAGTLGVGGEVRLSSAARDGGGTPANKKTLEAGQATLTSSGVIDLNDNDAIFHDDTPGARQKYEGFIAAARNFGAWDMPGITSTAAKNNLLGNTSLGVIDGSDYISVHGNVFNGRTVVPTDKLIKYTFYGDTDFNGFVDGDDYARADNGFNTGLSGWFNGDSDGNGFVDGDDYALMDNAFLTQNQTLSTAVELLAGPSPNRAIVEVLSDGSARLADGTVVAESVALVLEHADEYGDSYVNSFMSSAVPEPGSAGLLAGGATLGVLTSRRRRKFG
jgi:hypothetical protein